MVEGRPSHEVRHEQVVESSRMAQSRGLRVLQHDFNPIFSMPVSGPPTEERITARPEEATPTRRNDEPNGVVDQKAAASSTMESTPIASPAKNAETAPPVTQKESNKDGLMDLINAFVDKQMGLARQSGAGAGDLKDPVSAHARGADLG